MQLIRGFRMQLNVRHAALFVNELFHSLRARLLRNGQCGKLLCELSIFCCSGRHCAC
jgi:hypothetical protein